VATDPSVYALDSFALLAYLEGEVGKPRVKELLRGAESGIHTLYLSLINLGEVLYIIEREKGLFLAQRALAAIDQLPLQIVPVSRARVLAAAHAEALLLARRVEVTHFPAVQQVAGTVASLSTRMPARRRPCFYG